LIAWVRSERALRLATISARAASTVPSCPFGAPPGWQAANSRIRADGIMKWGAGDARRAPMAMPPMRLACQYRVKPGGEGLFIDG
jgi:hypothetical protein